MSIYGYEQAFGALDKTSPAMRKGIERWFAMHYNGAADDRADACQRIPYTVVNKLVKAVFGEYQVSSGEMLGKALLAELKGKERLAMQLALVGGVCYLKPCPVGTGFSVTLIPRDRILIFGRDGHGMPTDVGLVEKSVVGNDYFTLLERRTIDEAGYLTITNRHAHPGSPGGAGQRRQWRHNQCQNYRRDGEQCANRNRTYTGRLERHW